ncbi:MAG: hypothetical protein ACRC7N_17235 [Clostridium sp.]
MYRFDRFVVKLTFKEEKEYSVYMETICHNNEYKGKSTIIENITIKNV